MNNYNYNGYNQNDFGGYNFNTNNSNSTKGGQGQGQGGGYNYQYQLPTNMHMSMNMYPSMGASMAMGSSSAISATAAAAAAAAAAASKEATRKHLMPPPMAPGGGGTMSGLGAPGTTSSSSAAAAAMNMDRRIETENPEFRLRSKTVAVLDIGSAIVTMAFHLFTIITQEAVEDGKHSRKDVLVPFTPVQLQLHGYLLVLAWIGIFTVNIVQLVIGCTLLNSTSPEIEATKALSGSRTWIKTCIFILILLVFKLVILYFMSEMGTSVTFTTLICIMEFILRSIALVTVMKYLHAVTMAFPDASRIYYEAEQLVESPKRNPVTDAVWF